MSQYIFDLKTIRTEISFKSFEELRTILSFYQKNNLYKVNIPSKNHLKKDFLLNAIKISREEFPKINIIPHFSILYEFRRNRLNTLKSLNKFLQVVIRYDCKEVLLVSGPKKRLTLDSASTLSYLKDKSFLLNRELSFGVAFNPYLNNLLFEEEIRKLEIKLQSGLVSSIWLQFGTDHILLESRIEILKKIILSSQKSSLSKSKINLFGSILIPSKQFLARFKYRPWKGVYCSSEFLDSVDLARNSVKKLINIYSKNNILPIIETDVSSSAKINYLKMLLQS